MGEKVKKGLELHTARELENQSHISALEYSLSNVNLEKSANLKYDSMFEKIPYPKIPGS
jgi:hypothetical protein